MWRHNGKLLQIVTKRFQKMCTQTTRTVNLEIKETGKAPESNTKLQTVTTTSYLSSTNYRKQQFKSDEVPGPTSLKVVSKMWSVLPLIGTEATTRVIRYLLLRDSGKEPSKLFFKKLFDQYGPIVKLDSIFGNDVILLCRPEHAFVALSCETPFYIRSFFDSVEKYRQEWRKYTKNGPFFKFDDEWKNARNTLLESNLSVNAQYSLDDELCNRFVKRISEIENTEDDMSYRLKSEMYKWSLECLSMVLFKLKCGFLSPAALCPTSDPGRLLDGVMGATEALRKLENGFHFWKFIDTPTFLSLAKYCDLLDGVISKHVQKAMKNLRERKDKKLPFSDLCLVENLLMKKNLGEEDIMTILLDTFLITSNAASHIVTMLFFYLAKNPRSQIKLLEEIISKGEVVTLNTINKRPYLNACINECLGLDPPFAVVSRQLENDIILSHYHLPKGTHIFYSTHLNNNREEYFEDATRFKPERWLSGDLGEYDREYQAFATNCLGFGPDAKIVTDVMYAQIARIVVKTAAKFKIEYNFGDLRSNIEFLAPNNKQIRLRFVPRVK